MEKNKTYRVAHISMSKEHYDNFVSLPKSKQLEAVLKNMDPKDERQAQQALKNVPNGDNIGKPSTTEAVSDNKANDPTGGNKAGVKGSKPSPEES